MSKKDDCEAMSYTYTYIYTHKIKFVNEWRERERAYSIESYITKCI